MNEQVAVSMHNVVPGHFVRIGPNVLHCSRRISWSRSIFHMVVVRLHLRLGD